MEDEQLQLLDYIEQNGCTNNCFDIFNVVSKKNNWSNIETSKRNALIQIIRACQSSPIVRDIMIRDAKSQREDRTND